MVGPAGKSGRKETLWCVAGAGRRGGGVSTRIMRRNRGSLWRYARLAVSPFARGVSAIVRVNGAPKTAVAASASTKVLSRAESVLESFTCLKSRSICFVASVSACRIKRPGRPVWGTCKVVFTCAKPRVTIATTKRDGGFIIL